MSENEAISKIQWRINTISDIVGKGTDGKALEDLEMAIEALKIVAKMKEHCEGSCTDCPYHNQHMDKCMNDLLKGE